MSQFELHRSPGQRAWLIFFVPGMLLMLLGVAITIWPKLLVALVSGVFLLLGVVLASFGWRIRKGGMPPFGGLGGLGGLGGFGGLGPGAGGGLRGPFGR